MGLRRYIIKTYTYAGTYINTPSDVTFDEDIVKKMGSGLGKITFTFARRPENSGYNDEIKYGNIVKLYATGDTAKLDGELVFRGHMTGIKMAYGKEGVDVICEGPQYRLSKIPFRLSFNWIAPQFNNPPSIIMKAIVNSARWQEGSQLGMLTSRISNTSATSAQGLGNTHATTKVAQTFTNSTGSDITCAGIRTKISYDSGSVNTFGTTAYLYSYTAGNPDSGTLQGVGAFTGPVQTTMTSTSIILDIIWIKPVNLTNGSSYALVLDSTATGCQDAIRVYINSGGNPYAGGSYWDYIASTWTNRTTSDMYFDVIEIVGSPGFTYTDTYESGYMSISDEDSINQQFYFNGVSCLDAMKEVAKYAELDWFHRIDADGTVHFRKMGQASTLLDGMDATTGWSASDGFSGLTTGPFPVRNGALSLLVAFSGNTVGNMSKTITAKDLSKYRYLGVWVQGTVSSEPPELVALHANILSTAGNDTTWRVPVIFGTNINWDEPTFITFDTWQAGSSVTGTLNRSSVTRIQVGADASVTSISCSFLFDDMVAFNDWNIHRLELGKHFQTLESSGSISDIVNQKIFTGSSAAASFIRSDDYSPTDFGTGANPRYFTAFERDTRYTTSAYGITAVKASIKQTAYPVINYTLEVTNYPVHSIEPGDIIMLGNMPQAVTKYVFHYGREVNRPFAPEVVVDEVSYKNGKATLQCSRRGRDLRGILDVMTRNVSRIDNTSMPGSYDPTI